MSQSDTKHAPALAGTEGPGWKVARSLESSRVGEVMLLDRDGHVLSPRQTRWAIIGGWARVALVGASLAMLGVGLFGSIAFGLMMGATFTGAIGWQLRHQPALKRALALAAAGKRDEARAAFEALERRGLPAGYRPIIDMQLGGVLWLQGYFGEALDRYQRAIATYRTQRHYKEHPGYWICAFNRVQLLACSGDIQGAVVKAAELDGAPEGEFFRMERIATELLLAFHLDDPARLPDDLYDWARDILSMNRMGISAVCLAWAFDRRGDEDMARHMLREAPARLEGYYLRDSAPEVNAWMEQRAEAWGIDLDGDGIDDADLL